MAQPRLAIRLPGYGLVLLLVQILDTPIRRSRAPDTNDKAELTIAAAVSTYSSAHKYTDEQRPLFGTSAHIGRSSGVGLTARGRTVWS